MKIVRISFAVVALLCAPAARADTLEFSKVTCEEFVKADPATIGNLMMWLGGYYMGDEDDPVIDFDKLKKQGGELGKYCAENPTAKLSDAAEKIMGK
jgi:acid stress chaperone HdeB